MKHQPKICQQCQAKIFDGRSDKKFCSNTCKVRYHEIKKQANADDKTLFGLTSEETFPDGLTESEINNAFSELINQFNKENTTSQSCKYCQREFTSTQKGREFCSPICLISARTENLLRDIFIQNETSNKPAVEFLPGLNDHAREVNSGASYDSYKRQKHIEDFWTFCHATLWPDMDFSTEQQFLFRRLIGRYFDTTRRSELVFVELIERVCVLRIYFNRYRDIKIPQPENWLRGSQYCNLRCSQLWQEDFLKKIGHGKELSVVIKEVASAYHRFVQGNNLLVVRALRRELIGKKQPELLQIFTNAVMHQLFFQQ